MRTSVERLRIIARELDEGLPQDATACIAIKQAADEIERLRATLMDIATVAISARGGLI